LVEGRAAIFSHDHRARRVFIFKLSSPRPQRLGGEHPIRKSAYKANPFIFTPVSGADDCCNTIQLLWGFVRKPLIHAHDFRPPIRIQFHIFERDFPLF